MEPITERWVDLGYISTRYQVHHNTIYKAIHSGRLPAYRFGGRRFRFRIEDVEAWAQPYTPADGRWPGRGHLDDTPTGPIEIGEAALDAEAGA